MLFLSFFVFFLILLNLINAQYQNTQNCNTTTCKLPSCYCPSFNIPGNLSLNKTPQFILFSFDDSMYEADFNRMNNYSSILKNSLINDSLNCTIKVSWYSMEICKILSFFLNLKLIN